MVLRLKKVVTHLILLSSRSTVGNFIAFCEGRFRLCAKHRTWVMSASPAATYILDALSVTMTGSFASNLHSVTASFSNPAMFTPVWLSCIALVCRTYDSSSTHPLCDALLWLRTIQWLSMSKRRMSKRLSAELRDSSTLVFTSLYNVGTVMSVMCCREGMV